MIGCRVGGGERQVKLDVSNCRYVGVRMACVGATLSSFFCWIVG